ncbi:hypothetical protein RN001_003010 [Aquatica leii]|uniref:Uncharacterized protein n=1 Tax=Aquatica leii TaxID=1421715 RepID=A0AAN7SM35_9COLE|nr:hypothetical protein RN001_003010 [Aquatica leii]
MSPAELLLGIKIRNTNDILEETLKTDEVLQQHIVVREQNRETASDNIKRAQVSEVMLKKVPSAQDGSAKMSKHFVGPYRVETVLDKGRYVVSDIPSHRVTQKPYKGVLPLERLKLYSYGDDSDGTEDDENNEQAEANTDVPIDPIIEDDEESGRAELSCQGHSDVPLDGMETSKVRMSERKRQKKQYSCCRDCNE